MSPNETEIVFEVREAEEGGYWARALGANIFTQGEDWEDLKRMVRDAVQLFYEGSAAAPKVIRLLLLTTREETIPVNPIAA
jgi:hypothetical protein